LFSVDKLVHELYHGIRLLCLISDSN
jgi:hypothetical protein